MRGSAIVEAMDFIGVKSLRAKGKRITAWNVAKIEEIEPVAVEEEIVQEETAQPDDEADAAKESIIEERSDDEVRDELTGQQRIF